MINRTRLYRINSSTLLTAILSLHLLAGCGTNQVDEEYVARLGDQVFTRVELDAALASLSAAQDPIEAREQILEQWITNELLFREAVRRGLRTEHEVIRLLSENEKSVLISVLMNKLYEENDSDPDSRELLSYYEQHKDQLELKEPFVRVRYLFSSSADSASLARTILEDLDSGPNPDSAWRQLVFRFSNDPIGSLALSSSLYPESRFLSSVPGMSIAVRSLSPGQVLPPVELDGLFHVVQLVTRLPVGAIPDIAMVEDRLRERIRIENRKQLYARQVQRLRNEALAREDLDIR